MTFLAFILESYLILKLLFLSRLMYFGSCVVFFAGTKVTRAYCGKEGMKKKENDGEMSRYYIFDFVIYIFKFLFIYLCLHVFNIQNLLIID